MLVVGLVTCNVDEFIGDDKRPIEIPPRADCTRHLSACLETSLGSKRGGTMGSSQCKSCYDFCYGQREWHDTLPDGGDCRWWNYR